MSDIHVVESRYFIEVFVLETHPEDFLPWWRKDFSAEICHQTLALLGCRVIDMSELRKYKV